MSAHRTLYRWHIWLGWILAIPFLLWTASGLFMVARPIEEVRGEHLRAEAQAVDTNGLKLPQITGAVKAMRLANVGSKGVWIVEADNTLSRYDAKSGALLTGVNESDARTLADGYYLGEARLDALQRFGADQTPFDLRKARPSWQANFSDGTHVYVDADTGELLAIRTKQWRAFDFMWGLHILDPQTREDTSHPLLIGAALLGFASVVIGIVMLVLRQKRKRRV